MKRKLLAFGMAGILLLVVASISVAEPEFSVTGWFRARSFWITNPDLKKGGPERSYSDQRLILNPSLKISDWVTVNMRIRALDYIWGNNGVPGLTWPEMSQYDPISRSIIEANQGESGTNNFQWDRAWVHIFFGKYGSLMIGRQKTDLYYNYSIAEDDTYPRYHYIGPVFSLPNENNIMFGILYDKRAEGDIDVVTGDGVDDSQACIPWVAFWNPQISIGTGAFLWNWAGKGPNGEASTWIQWFGKVETKIGPADIKLEWDDLFGNAIGSYDDVKHTFQFFVDASVPIEASSYLDRAAVVVALFQGNKAPEVGIKWGSIGSNEDWMDDWKIDIILWDQIFNSIYNAWVIRPKIDFVVPDTRWGGYVSAALSFADQEAQYNPGTTSGAVLTTGTEKGIGTELDLGINYTLGPLQTMEVVFGIFMPGKYFHEDNRDSSFGAVVKTHIKF